MVSSGEAECLGKGTPVALGFEPRPLTPIKPIPRPMKRIEALCPHDRIQEVGRALRQFGVKGLTLTTVYRLSDHPRAVSPSPAMENPCCKVDVLVSNEQADEIRSLLSDCIAGRFRDCVFVVQLETTIRIRTGESEEAALC